MVVDSSASETFNNLSLSPRFLARLQKLTAGRSQVPPRVATDSS